MTSCGKNENFSVQRVMCFGINVDGTQWNGMEYDTKIGFCLLKCHMSSSRSDSFTCHGISFYRGNRLSSVTNITIMIIVLWNVTQCRLREGSIITVKFLKMKAAYTSKADPRRNHCRKNVKSIYLLWFLRIIIRYYEIGHGSHRLNPYLPSS
jgi:hypothetical protein